jgi:hypothetical protein
MDNEMSGGTPLDDELDHNKSGNEVEEAKLERIKAAKLESKRAEEEYRREEQQKAFDSRDIIREVKNIDPEDLIAHSINQVLYGDEPVDNTLVNSIIRKGQLEPIVVTEINPENGKYTIISGHRRWLALRYINKIKLPIQVRDMDSVMDYNPVTLKDDEEYRKVMAKCVIAHFDSSEDEILAIIDYNKRREKRPSQYYNEIATLFKIYNAEKDRKRDEHIESYINVSDLKRTLPDLKKPEGSTEKDEEYYLRLYYEGKISKDKIKSGTRYKTARDDEWQRNLDKVAEEVGLGRTNIHKIKTIGDLAIKNKDKYAIEAMEFLDRFIWTYNNAYNVARLRKIQLDHENNTNLFAEIEEKMQQVFIEPDETKHEKPVVITDETIKHYQDIINEFEAQKKEEKTINKFSVILIEPDNDFETFTATKLHADTSSALFIISNHENLIECIKIMARLNYDYRTYYFYLDQIMLLGTKSKLSPTIMTDKIENRSNLYAKIKKYYSKDVNFHEVPSKHTDKDEPIGWEIPIGKEMSDKQAKAKKGNSKEKTSQNITSTDKFTGSQNGPVGAGQA